MSVHRASAVAIVMVIVTASAAPARAGCDVEVALLQAWRGAVARGARCGSIVVATDAGATRSSQARIVVPATIPYTMVLDARRLTGVGVVQLELQGAYLMWRDGAWGVYFDEAQFARDGWHRVPGLDARRAHHVVVERTVGAVAITFDGAALGRWSLPDTAGVGPSIGLTGRRGARARLLVRGLAVTPGVDPS